MTINRLLSSVIFVLLTLVFCSRSSQAQQKKGDFEIIGSSGSTFAATFSGSSEPSSNQGPSFALSTSQQSFNITGDVGYFLTRRHEVGGGLGLFVSHFKLHSRSFMDGKLVGEFRLDDTSATLGVDGFYRYNIAKPDAKGFPFVGVSVAVASVTQNITGNFTARPHAGYKYFLKRNVALDASVGFRFDINKSDSDESFVEDRRKSIDGRVGLSFVF